MSIKKSDSVSSPPFDQVSVVERPEAGESSADPPEKDSKTLKGLAGGGRPE